MVNYNPPAPQTDAQAGNLSNNPDINSGFRSSYHRGTKNSLLSPNLPSEIVKDRSAFHEAIAEYYKADHDKAMQILEKKEPGWEKAFIDQRHATMHKVAKALPELFKKYKHLLSEDDLKPRNSTCLRDDDFKWIILNVDKDLGFFITALVFDPGQATPPHTHKTLCFGVQYKGETEEFIFDPSTHKVVDSVLRNDPYHIEVASPEGHGDLHAVANSRRYSGGIKHSDDMAVAVHIYDGYNLKAMLDRGEVVPMITGKNYNTLGGADALLSVAGFPSPGDGMRVK